MSFAGCCARISSRICLRDRTAEFRQPADFGPMLIQGPSQKESEETTSPPARVEIACQTPGFTAFLANTTWPSQ